MGGTGTGKTHLATAIAVNHVRLGKRCRYFGPVDLLNRLEREQADGRAGRLVEQLGRVVKRARQLFFGLSGGQPFTGLLIDMRGRVLALAQAPQGGVRSKKQLREKAIK